MFWASLSRGLQTFFGSKLDGVLKQCNCGLKVLVADELLWRKPRLLPTSPNLLLAAFRGVFGDL